VKEEGRPEAESYGYGPDGKVAKLNPKNGPMTVHILLDIPSVEVVTSTGDYIIKGRDYRKLDEKSPLEIRAAGGDVTFSRLEVYPLKSIHSGGPS
jgi:sucrose-6-phosphate hydrolase SacC (GH32 family)